MNKFFKPEPPPSVTRFESERPRSVLEHSGTRHWHQEPKPVSTLVFVALLLVDCAVTIGITVSIYALIGMPDFVWRLVLVVIVFKLARWARKSSMESAA